MNQNQIIMKNYKNTHFIDNVVDALRKAADEMEEFQVQASLGKTEALDKYEQIKKNFNLFIHDSKFKIKEGKEKIENINNKIEELRKQLVLKKVKTTETFKEQKEQLLLTLQELEDKIRENKTLNNMYAFMLIEMEKFRVQLDILEHKFDESKENAQISFEARKREFNKFVGDMKEKFTKKEETKWEHFQSEISEAFTHLKGVFTKV